MAILKESIRKIPLLNKCFPTILKAYLAIHKLILYVCWYVFRLFPVKHRKIIFSNFNGAGFGDNPKFIAEEFLRRDLSYTYIWVAGSKDLAFPAGIKTVSPNTIAFVYHMVTAGFWIDNTRKLYFFKKRKGQTYVQTWHGGPGLKKVEADAEQALSKEYTDYAKYDSSQIDLFLSCCRWCSDLYHKSFWYQGPLLEKGIPKNDVYFTDPTIIRKKIYEYFEIPDNKKLIMYAPTYRDDRSTGAYNLDGERCLKALKERFLADFVLLIRLHPNVSYKDDIFTYNDHIKNASRYDNMQDLLVACDMIITDYSGCAFDYPILKKPGFLYAEDYAEMKNLKDYYFNLQEMPFSLALNNDELLLNILTFNTAEYEKKCTQYVKRIGYFDNGNASKAVVDWILAH